ncbi:MAG: NeuD/PglB/VioB family sugar acetyltransferase [Thiotrichaceae bacterium]
MINIVVIGGGGHAKVVISVLKKINDYRIYGYVSKENCGDILGIPFLGGDEVLPDLVNSQHVQHAVIAVGASVTGQARSEIAELICRLRFSFPTIVSPDSMISCGVKLGEGVFVNDGASIGPDVKIDSFSIINRNSSVDHDSEIGKHVHIAPNATLAGGVIIGDYVQVGIGSTIIENRKIANKVIIGAGAVIIRDCAESTTYIGVPGRAK